MTEWPSTGNPSLDALALTIDDMVTDLLYYDRKEDDELPVNRIEELIAEGIVTQAWIVERFATCLREGLGE